MRGGNNNLKGVVFVIFVIFGAYFLNYFFDFFLVPEWLLSVESWIFLIGGILLILGGINYLRASKVRF